MFPLSQPLGTNPSAAALAGASGSLPFVIGKSGIPFIHLSSGSVAANGAISAITALPRTIPNAYCWFPANALAAVSAAGWYYCTFSAAAVGIAFLDTYVGGKPTIPAIPTPVVDGRGAFVSDTAEHVGPSIVLPAGAMGPNGALRITTYYSASATAGTKTGLIRLGGIGGPAFGTTSAFTNTQPFRLFTEIVNKGVANVQLGGATTINNASAANTVPVAGAIDTNAATTIDHTLAKNTAADNMILEDYLDEVIAGA